jgi:HD-GYP domain-containing protein (c-di-GMP phosphodiesterase class II)
VWVGGAGGRAHAGALHPAADLDEAARAFADMVDLKTPYTLGHSAAVAELAVDAAGRLGLDAAVTPCVAPVCSTTSGASPSPSAIWEQPRPLSSLQWEQVRLHPYHTERILDRSAALADLAPIAGMHHERQDGSGYHHGRRARRSRWSAPARRRGRFQAMTQPRPHRPALVPSEAAGELEAAGTPGRWTPSASARSSRPPDTSRLPPRHVAVRAVRP